jgi:hypothetical protein
VEGLLMARRDWGESDPEYMKLWYAAVDADATEYVYWRGYVPSWWNCNQDGSAK